MSIETKINKIVEWHEQQEHVNFVATPSGKFFVGSKRVKPEFWDSADGPKVAPELMHVAILEDAYQDEDFVAIEFDTKSKAIQSVYLCLIDNILVLGRPGEGTGKITVQMLKRPSLCYLDEKNKNFNYIYDMLSQAYNNDVEAIIAVPPGENFIEDAVVAEPLN